VDIAGRLAAAGFEETRHARCRLADGPSYDPDLDDSRV
jgi:hypothetical protein